MSEDRGELVAETRQERAARLGYDEFAEKRSPWAWLKKSFNRGGQEKPQAMPESKKLQNFTREYEVSGEKVSVDWVECIPSPLVEPKEEDKHKLPISEVVAGLIWKDPNKPGTVVHTVGWSGGLGESSINTAQRLADLSRANTLCVQPRTGKNTLEDRLWYESEAVRQLIEERVFGQKGSKEEIVLTGHSQGASEAVNLEVGLKGNNRDVRGLVLFSPVGLYDQSALKLAMKFAWDSMVATMPSFPAKAIEQLRHGKLRPDLSRSRIPLGLRRPDIAARRGAEMFDKTGSATRAGLDIMAEIFKEARRSGPKGLVERTINQVQEMAKANPRLKEVASPIIIVAGSKDPIAVPDRLINEVLVPKSPHVETVTGDEHHGLPHWLKNAPRDGLYLLNRFNRGGQIQASSQPAT